MRVVPRIWSARGAYEVGRHAAQRVEGGYSARNPSQRWTTRFDGRAFTTQPDAGGWTWGLELLRYGFAGSEQEVTSPDSVSADGERMSYAWDAIHPVDKTYRTSLGGGFVGFVGVGGDHEYV